MTDASGAPAAPPQAEERGAHLPDPDRRARLLERLRDYRDRYASSRAADYSVDTPVEELEYELEALRRARSMMLMRSFVCAGAGALELFMGPECKGLTTRVASRIELFDPVLGAIYSKYLLPSPTQRVHEDATNVARETFEDASPSPPESAAGYDDPCCICLDEMGRNQDIRHIRCGHGFHAACIDQWLAVSSECPLCRTAT